MQQHTQKWHFNNSPATQALRRLAEHPIDLTKPGSLTPERIAGYKATSCGYDYLYATERVSDEVLSALELLATEASVLEKMSAMQAGDIMNTIEGFPSENRPALHTALRDLFDHPQEAPKAREAASLARLEIGRLKAFMEKVDKENRFDELIVIGIGGSDQGPRANFVALEHLAKPGRKVHFIANVDPDDAAAVLNGANLKRSLVVTISKSGTTLETATNEAFASAALQKAGCAPKNHLVSITMPGTPMDNKEIYLETFHLWDFVGGRYSTTSMVGGLILSFAYGFPIFQEFLRGAHEMDRAALRPNIKENIPLLSALIGVWNRNFLHLPTFAIIPYAQALRDYPAHLQQVDMESNGKMINQQGTFVNFETGPVLWGSLGTNAQHSYFQLLHQGTAVIPLLLIGFKQCQRGSDLLVKETTSQEKLLANLFAQSLALALGSRSDNPNKCFPGNRPTSILLGEQLTPYALGALLAFYEHRVAFQGFIWGVNSFDQEGVQLGKVLANRLIDTFAAKRKKTFKKGQDPLGEAFLNYLT